MSEMKKKIVARKKRHFRVRKKVKGAVARPRLSVFRSSKHIYAQIIDDTKGVTLVSVSELGRDFLELVESLEQNKKNTEGTEKRTEKSRGLDKTERAGLIGKMVAEGALKIGIRKVVFDRGGYKYHGRLKALAEGARKQDLNL